MDFSTAHLIFIYHPIATISKIEPTFGPQSGGNMIQVTGAGFRNTHRLGAMFANAFETAASLALVGNGKPILAKVCIPLVMILKILLASEAR